MTQESPLLILVPLLRGEIGDEMREGREEARIALGLALIGLALVVVGVFLPVWDVSSVGFFRVKENSLMQSGDGWLTLVAAGVSGLSIFRVMSEPRRVIWPLLSGVALLGYAVWIGTSETQMTLCSVGENGLPDKSLCQQASPGLGVYLVGVGGAALLVAGLMLVRLPPRGLRTATLHAATATGTIPDEALAIRKECDHCKTPIRPDATVCAACRRDVEPWTFHEGRWWQRDATSQWWYRGDDGAWNPVAEDDELSQEREVEVPQSWLRRNWH